MKIEDVEKEVGIPIKEIKKKLEQAGFKKRIGGIITEEEYRYLKGLKGGRTNNGEDQFLTETKYTKDDFIFETISVKDENLWNEELFFKPTAEIKEESNSGSHDSQAKNPTGVSDSYNDDTTKLEEKNNGTKKTAIFKKENTKICVLHDNIKKTKDEKNVNTISDSAKKQQEDGSANSYKSIQANKNKRTDLPTRSSTDEKDDSKVKEGRKLESNYGDDKKESDGKERSSFIGYHRKVNTDNFKKNRLLKKEKNKNRKLNNLPKEDRKIVVTNKVSVKDLAGILKCKEEDLMSLCVDLNIPISTPYQTLERDVITLLSEAYDYTVSFPEGSEKEIKNKEITENAKTRKPIITVVGHVDHGKTTLVDYICKTSVAKTEKGGITQNINAYNITTEAGEEFTLIDTPGHKIFTEMRARAINIADIAIVIIAADSGVQDQTKEILQQITFFGKPVVFAFNKIDKEGVNIEKINEKLANLNFLVEDWGGKYQCQGISAQKGIGVKELLEKVILEATMLDLKVDYDCQAKGVILDSLFEKTNGYQNKILIKEGTLKQNDFLVTGTLYGKIRQMKKGDNIVKEAYPSESVVITGISGCAQPGDSFTVVANEREAREGASRYQQILREQNVKAQQRMTFDMLKVKMLEGDKKTIGIIINACSRDICRVIVELLSNFSSDKYSIDILKENVGEVLTSDVDAAAFSKAIIIGFNVKVSPATIKYAEKNNVIIKTYNVIYDLSDHIDEILASYDDTNREFINVGKAEVVQIFKIKKVGTIAGCVIREGAAHIKDMVNVNRNGKIVFSGTIKSMKHSTADITEAKLDSECGVCINRYDDVKKGDILEFMQRK